MAEESKKEVAVTKGPAVTAPAVFNPFQEMERMFDEFMGRGWMRPMRWDRPLFPEFPSLLMPSFELKGMPKVDVVDRDEEIVVRAELPGVEKDNVSVTLSDNVMTIKAESKRETKEEKGDYHRSEIYRGSFQRTFTLPAAVDEGKAKASMKDGILEVIVPKIEKSKRHSVKVD
jgi:HSP20 family protein